MVQKAVRKDCTKQPNRYVTFYPENTFQLKSQSYWKGIVLRSLLFAVFIGKPPLLSRVRKNIVWKTKNTILLHVASSRRATEIFSIAGLNAAEFEDQAGRMSCMCRKVEVQFRDGKKSGRIHHR